jgi:hypothetical protein
MSPSRQIQAQVLHCYDKSAVREQISGTSKNAMCLLHRPVMTAFCPIFHTNKSMLSSFFQGQFRFHSMSVQLMPSLSALESVDSESIFTKAGFRHVLPGPNEYRTPQIESEPDALNL